MTPRNTYGRLQEVLAYLQMSERSMASRATQDQWEAYQVWKTQSKDNLAYYRDLIRIQQSEFDVDVVEWMEAAIQNAYALDDLQKSMIEHLSTLSALDSYDLSKKITNLGLDISFFDGSKINIDILQFAINSAKAAGGVGFVLDGARVAFEKVGTEFNLDIAACSASSVWNRSG